RPLLAPTSSSCSPCPSPRSPSLLLNAPPPTAISPLSLHDALPIFARGVQRLALAPQKQARAAPGVDAMNFVALGERRKAHHLPRSEEHTSELQSLTNLVCRLLLEKKNNNRRRSPPSTYSPPPRTHP